MVLVTYKSKEDYIYKTLPNNLRVHLLTYLRG